MKKLYLLTALLGLAFPAMAMEPTEMVQNIQVVTSDGDVFQTHSVYLECSNVLEMLKNRSNSNEP